MAHRRSGGKSGFTGGVILAFAAALLALFSAVHCPAENAVSVGYGFGLWNGSSSIGRLDDKRYYDYATVSYIYERGLLEKLSLVVEPFLNIVNRPDVGLDLGFSVQAKAYFAEFTQRNRLYVLAGAGAAYTTINFAEQGTHGLFLLEGGVGYRYDPVFVDVRFRHYSNGNLAWPNRSVNSGVVKVGYYF